MQPVVNPDLKPRQARRIRRILQRRRIHQRQQIPALQQKLKEGAFLPRPVRRAAGGAYGLAVAAGVVALPETELLAAVLAAGAAVGIPVGVMTAVQRADIRQDVGAMMWELRYLHRHRSDIVYRDDLAFLLQDLADQAINSLDRLERHAGVDGTAEGLDVAYWRWHTVQTLRALEHNAAPPPDSDAGRTLASLRAAAAAWEQLAERADAANRRQAAQSADLGEDSERAIEAAAGSARFDLALQETARLRDRLATDRDPSDDVL